MSGRRAPWDQRLGQPRLLVCYILGKLNVVADSLNPGDYPASLSFEDVSWHGIRIPKGEDGLTYLRKVRSYCHDDPQEQARIRKTPVLIVTGAGTSMQAIFELEGISGFIEKPFDIADLHSRIQHVLKPH